MRTLPADGVLDFIPSRSEGDDRWTVTVTFSGLATHILCGRAAAGGLFADEVITVVVHPRLVR